MSMQQGKVPSALGSSLTVPYLGKVHTLSQRRKSQHAAQRGTSSCPEYDTYLSLKDFLWIGTEEEALKPGSFVEQLSAPWKITLLSDGSVTRHLQLMTGQRVTVDCIEMKDVGLFSADSIPCTLPIEGLEEGFDTVRRQVFLKMSNATEQPYVYAVSWWHKDVVDEYLKDRQQPIWTSLSSERTELFREIIEVQCGFSDELEEYFGCPGPFWGRTYIFWHNKMPLTIIYEVFSPLLHEYLGPSCPLPNTAP